MRNFYRVSLYVLIAFASPWASYGQISLPGKPYTTFLQEQSGKLDLAPSDYLLPAVNNESELNRAKIAQAACNNCQEYFGKGISVSVDLKSVSRVITVPGGKIWLMKFKSANAKGMQFHFDRYKLPKKASLFIYNEDKSQIIGAFSHINNHVDGKFATQLVRGKEITLEYFEATDNEFAGELRIIRVIHAFKEVVPFSSRDAIDARTEWTALPCTIDMKCDPGPQYSTIKKSVCRITTHDSDNDFSGYGTGFLINNLASSRMPYVLTAFHLVPDNVDPTDRFSNWIFEFDYEKTDCNQSNNTTFNTQSHGGAQPVAGSQFASGYEADYILLDLQTGRLEDWLDVVYAGWDRRTGITFPGTAGISHPNGDVKKISVAQNVPPSGVYTRWNPGAGINGQLDDLGTSGPITDWKVAWTSGITMGGSSGSPLFDQGSQLAIGYLKAGQSDCSSDGSNVVHGPDYYGKISYGWDKSDAPFLNPMNHYLDPQSTNTNILLSYVPSQAPPGGTNGGSDCTTMYGGFSQTPTVPLGSFETDAMNQCVTSWHFLTGQIIPFCYHTTSGYYKAAQMYANGILGSEMYKAYSFVQGKEYIISLKVFSDPPGSFPYGIVNTNNLNLGPLYVSLKNSVYTPSACSSYGNPQVGPSDQLIMRLDPPDYSVNTGNKFNTYAIKFVPNTNYQYISIIFAAQYNSSVAGSQYSSVLVDEINLFDKGAFINPQCYDNLTTSDLSTVIPFEGANTSVTLQSNGSVSPVLQNGQTFNVKSRNIFLKPGFQALAGSSFNAQYNDCMDWRTPDNPYGPLEANKHTTLLRQRTDSLPDPVILYNFETKQNIYRTDIGEEPEILNEDAKCVIVSPNPTRGRINVKFETPQLQIPYTVINSRGQELCGDIVSQKNLEIDLSSYPSGVYFVKAIIQGKYYVSKVILSK